MTREDIQQRVAGLQTKEDLLCLLNQLKEEDLGHDKYAFTLCQLNYYCNPNNTRRRYTSFEIRKKSGGVRQIDAPRRGLKNILYYLNKIFQSIYTPSSAATGFVQGKSVVDNAQCHIGKNYVFNIDLKDFFDSIHIGRVCGFFEKNKYFNLPHEVAVTIAQLACYQGKLPQGAPTSPMLSNMVFKRTDDGIFSYCCKRGIMYTRYADDMVFSSNNLNASQLISYVTMRVENIRMNINESKTKVMSRGVRQNVTGVVVNDKLQVSRNYRMKIRQEMFFIQKYRFEEHLCRVKDIPSWIQNPLHYAHHLYGKICFVLQINPKDNVFKYYKEWLKEQILQME